MRARSFFNTSQPHQDAQQTIDAFKAKYPKVDITFVRDGTPRIVAKLRAELEAGQAQADILLNADAVTMEDLKKDGRLLAYPEADVAAYPSGVHDKDKMWFATKLITTTIVVGVVMVVLDRLRAKVPRDVLPWVMLAFADTREK